MPRTDDALGSRRDAGAWAGWFWHEFLASWRALVSDMEGGGVFDALDAHGRADPLAEKTVLAQARTLFALSHLALLSGGDPALTAAAARQSEMLRRFRKPSGLYRRAVAGNGTATGNPADEIARSYDQSFVLLGLVTWNRLCPSAPGEAEAETCWQAIETGLTDPATGLLLEHDGIADPAAPDAPPRAQNPHMHLYEACLQAFEMTGNAVWMTRAARLRDLSLRYFLDRETGSIMEFLTPDLSPLPGMAGSRREPGHQCEWAWLLTREADLGGDAGMRAMAARLEDFALAHGFARGGALAGAAFDAVSAQGAVIEETFLLWPQTEAIKMFAMRHLAGDPAAGDRAAALLELMFRHWFADRPVWVNRLDAQGRVIWPEGLTRLFYHLALALTEGARAGLWSGINPD